jgi:hypothetical protein
MAFKLTRKAVATADSPEALFRDLRKRQVAGLLSHQADMLREYQSKALNSRDVALQLPTGSGKTLVGLLIGEWRRRAFQEKVVYICPTRQLAHQVVNQSLDKYGIKANPFVGKQAEYTPDKKAEYEGADTIAVTTYSGLFNINPYFADADVLILDDVHAAESYIASFWSLLVDRNNEKHKSLFNSVLSIISSKLQMTDRVRLQVADITRDAQWVDKLATPHFDSVLAEITAAFDEHTPKSDLKYAWGVIRDHLYACHLYLSINAFLLRPFIPPTQTHGPFANPKQRLYMSATLSESGDLERTVGVRKIDRLPVPTGWDKQGIGRRLFFFPERSLQERQATKLAVKMCNVAGRSLVLVPDDRSEEEFKKLAKASGHTVFDATEMERSKESFTSSEKAVAVIANRYDGIDMLNNECRLLIVKGFPRATNIQERFIVTRLAATLLLNDRILTRIIQAFGRCTRSATDYSAVVVLGEELLKCLSDPKRLAFLHPEIQAELQFGLDESKGRTTNEFLAHV